MLSKFFIDRPVLTIVVACLVIMFGLMALPRLELSRYPNIAPPSVRITFSYPGASAETLENTVSQVVEQQMTGLDNLLYFSSRANSEGRVNIVFSFEPGTDPDIAQMQVQNRLDAVLSSLPEAVQDQGVRIRKVSDDTLQTIAFYSDDGSLTQEDVADFLSSVVQDPLSRVNGVGSVTLFGAQYAMRIWLDLNKLHYYGLNPSDVTTAVTNQNQQVSVGQLGALPNVDGQPINVNVKSRELLKTIEDFENILVKTDVSGAAVYIKDVAKVEMGRENYTYFGNYNARPMAAIQIELSEGANAVDTSDRVAALLESMRPLFPATLVYDYPYDTVPFVKASLVEVTKTLVEALVLVALVIFVFLRSLRTTLVVAVTVPVVLSGTLTVLWALGYSINTLTMFAMILAIGLLVDDAIVVVENVNRLVTEEGLELYDAAVRSMKEISSALFGVGLVIAAVFTPMSFFSGATGNIYRQFSVTIVSAMLLSILTALIITPSFCTHFLKLKPQRLTPDEQHRLEEEHKLQEQGFSLGHEPHGIDKIKERSNNWFFALRDLYLKFTHAMVRHIKCMTALLVSFCAAAALMFYYIPTSFLPVEDQGFISARIVLSPGSTQQMTQAVALEIQNYFLTEEKEHLEGVMLSLGAAGASSSGQSAAQLNIRLKDWDERDLVEGSAQAILDRAKQRFDGVFDAQVNFYLPPSVRGLGSSSGFSVYVQNVSGNPHEDFLADVQEIVQRANDNVHLYNVRYDSQDDSPQLNVMLDDHIAGQLNLDVSTVNTNLSIAWGGRYVNDFIDRGRIKSVYVQALPEFRSLPQNLGDLYLRNEDGQMVSLSEFAFPKCSYGPVQLERFNGVSAIQIVGDPAAGISSGEAMTEIARIIRAHPGNYNYAWFGASYQEVLAGAQVPILFSISALIVFMCLAALYESWSIPLAVILVIPVGVAGALLFVILRDMTNDVYLQVGLLTTGGLAAKNAILIVEYAEQFRARGMTLVKSAMLSARMRFRPILMTSAAFLLGIVPLAVAQGAGAVSQQSIGTGIIGGTLFATSFGIAMVPSCFVLISLIFNKKLRRRLRRFRG